ncbi:MAG: hypothetical protein HC896_00265 [Bacteroidales bacterium]|nr:hypothetical protein [Bacteroidales bacterium]
MKFTDEQIKEYKKQHERIFQVDSEDKTCLLRLATKDDLSYASTVATSEDPNTGDFRFDPMKFNEAILINCWVAGDEEIKTVSRHFLGVQDKLKL